MENVISLKNIFKSFKDVHALEDISFEVPKNQWLSIMGPSGSGKTTLINILSLMDNPTSGIYELLGKDVANLSQNEHLKIRRETIGLIFQQFHLIPYLSVLENVMLAQYYHSSVEVGDAKAMLDMVGLGHRFTHLPSQLSGGEQQRVCIARALINNPEILIADEPTGNLDEKNEGVVLELFQKIKKDGKTIILITHNPNLGKQGDRMITLSHGKLINDEKIN
ncbi:ABC transporter ATP-binding protein [Campylobacter ureolyticus]|uniref:Ferrirhodotorulic acid ABC transporter, ATP-binding protein n=1 Tax=Campylobacter ureolyticus TaxID=827 RepID=A0AAE7E8V0_9BACT|nr:ABC transporter ATP-binding protein [Campylobacter ureolyticus]MCR8684179.1 ABC transporter ATP-binding protein [Campylobacter ureolyticus]QKF83774.1 ferrirhodotorulic acid ABC transporter, ATP-binding protein [Campylobacter ureolyticus]QQY36071.1 ABC transporter ATP-binding protein [Campylobacter ureolyticus]SUX24789.1 response regulatory protein [Campylobacter ureolyticus]GKH59909.1 ABC transporter ATP-binding protein [Campylobacter ureolyticus]